MAVKRIIAYDMAKGYDTSELVEEVNKMIAMGYQPLGGVGIASDSDGCRYTYQAMVMYSATEEL